MAKKLVDQRGWYYLLTVEPDRYLHWGEHEDKGLVTNDPPFAFFDTGYAFGKTYQTAHLISDGSARGAEVVFHGYESIQVPAGEFKNCLKTTFKYINPNGSTFTSVTYLAKGVGPVRKEFAIYSPRAGQTLRFDRELIHATIGGQKVGGKKGGDRRRPRRVLPVLPGRFLDLRLDLRLRQRPEPHRGPHPLLRRHRVLRRHRRLQAARQQGQLPVLHLLLRARHPHARLVREPSRRPALRLPAAAAASPIPSR